ncbi:MAG TPA: hypothetical protein VMP13_06150 [Acidimicrobiia bacterium]|nr:hypothetical protein [Acidimicrobiia bacterium]
MATTLGGLGGTATGLAVGAQVANANPSSGLQGLGRALLFMLISLCLGSALGVGLTLRLSGHRRPLITAILAMPAVFLAVVVGLRVSSFFDRGGVLAGVLQILVVILSLWLTRVVVMAWSRPDPGPLRAE